MAKVWRTLEELNAAHERLVAEVEKLKKGFEASKKVFGSHTHRGEGEPLVPVALEPETRLLAGPLE